jgi:hypothetical protein
MFVIPLVPWHSAQDFVKACGVMLTLLCGRDTKVPKEDEPLPKNISTYPLLKSIEFSLNVFFVL